MKKRWKIYYVPGMISLIFLPVLCIGVLKKPQYEERCLNLNMLSITDRDRLKNAGWYVSTIFDLERNYIHFELTGNADEDNKTLNLFKDKLLQIVENEDTITGLHVDIRDKVKYGSIIELLDACLQDTLAAGYALQDNEFWYLHVKKVSEEEKKRHRERYNAYKDRDSDFRIDCEVIAVPDKQKDSFIDKIYAFFQDEGIIKMRYFFILFFAFFIISMIDAKKKFWGK